jgi:hypothetical protein
MISTPVYLPLAVGLAPCDGIGDEHQLLFVMWLPHDAQRIRAVISSSKAATMTGC